VKRLVGVVLGKDQEIGRFRLALDEQLQGGGRKGEKVGDIDGSSSSSSSTSSTSTTDSERIASLTKELYQSKLALTETSQELISMKLQIAETTSNTQENDLEVKELRAKLDSEKLINLNTNEILEKTNKELIYMKERYMLSARSHEPTLTETQLIEAKLSLAQAKGGRELVALRYRELEKEYLKLKLELAESKSREDDAMFLNDVLLQAKEQLIREQGVTNRLGGGETGTGSGHERKASLNPQERFAKALGRFLVKPGEKIKSPLDR